ncbi:Predicted regulator of Ras-like GTPase activity, Roadblock/LC7/MglB family [Actinacidiphila yanglinensis]|uniref:Predicted regulator of Ras-like GTPase activity, Roadblock/LC7/MglB family n=1 Tax=Actinacidiphila yanglinensis TaxID=310779 RepID=A0A1H6CTQ8_9ACTN|nr:roadblock/LC7 domain-containing protein [Actinacidiphila yanglinensis]SEG76459.1 Predicted regulator of Ras-like GTPase activity, Roadblock/LC7/MglB family [Actinacidiphila yanglinensis]
MIPTVNPQVQKTVEEHLAQVRGVRGALVVAADGLPLCGYELDDERIEHWAALGATLMGVARRAAERAEGRGIRTLVVDMNDGRIVLAEAGGESVLLVIAAQDAELDPSGPELSALTDQLTAILGSGPTTTD